ncbi:MAG: hypothetical protein RLZZ200_3089 [Pseudomonadota bacterium]|jgi:oligopeptide transport system ATP-binding protein
MSGPLLLEGRDLVIDYRRAGGLLRAGESFRALEGASFGLAAGESLAVVGESGSGKSTLARAALRLIVPTSGQVLLRGEDLAILSAEELRQRRRDLQLVFQDPLACLDPRMHIEEILAQPLRVFEPGLSRAGRLERAEAAMHAVGLEPGMLGRYPHQFSGGQAQRIGIARALITDPAVLVCDEPVSALDVSIRAQVLDLLASERARRNLALMFIAHDLAAVRFLCERILVLYRGQVMEQGPTSEIFARPRHPYTQLLLSAALVADPRRARRRGHPVTAPATATEARAVPRVSSGAVSSGCVFAARCPRADVHCTDARPRPRVVDGVTVACHHPG